MCMYVRERGGGRERKKKREDRELKEDFMRVIFYVLENEREREYEKERGYKCM